jgi:electron transfer flavoprotein alpha subunit
MNDTTKIRKILIFADTTEGKALHSFREMFSKAKEICPEALCAAAYIGEENPDVRSALQTSGIDVLYVAEDNLLENFHPQYYCAILEEALKDFDPDLLLICATAVGEELAPAMGVRFGTGVAAHCVDIGIDEEGETVQLVPAFGGKVIGEIYIPATRPRIVTVKPGIFSLPQKPYAGKDCAIVPIDTKRLKSMDTSIEVIEAVESEYAGLPVEQADLIVCGGYGLKNKASFDSLKKLAEHLSGALGYTRPAVDSGWVEHERNMIGTSGKTVKPKVYIGFGISGATHHVCAMKNSGTVISVNNDPAAAIFNVSDFYAVDDASTIIDAMIEITESNTEID